VDLAGARGGHQGCRLTRGGTRFAAYPSKEIPKTVPQRIAAAGRFHKITGKGETVALHIPWDGSSAKAIYKGLRGREKMLIEYKLFEPGFYSTAIQDYARSRSLCRMLGPKAKVLVDLGHHAPSVNVEQIIAHLVREGDLGGIHFNDSYYADDDLATGSLHPHQIFRIMCTLVEGERLGYQKVGRIAFMIDQSHCVKDPLEELVESTKNIETAYAKALLVDWDALKKAQDACDPSKADAILNDAFLTDVRPLLAKARS
jgi:L-rhamnose isomerase/sugar isomerase